MLVSCEMLNVVLTIKHQSFFVLARKADFCCYPLPFLILRRFSTVCCCVFGWGSFIFICTLDTLASFLASFESRLANAGPSLDFHSS